MQPKADGERWLLGIRFRAIHERDRSVGTALYRAMLFPLPDLSALAPSDQPEPGGPKRIIEEFEFELDFVESLLAVLTLLATYALYVMLVIDLARAALAFRRR